MSKKHHFDELEPIEASNPIKKRKDDGFKFADRSVFTLAAPRRSGKSYFIRAYLNKYEHMYDQIFIMCKSLEFNGDYDEFTSEKYTKISDVTTQNIDKLFTTQEEAMRETNKLNEKFEYEKLKRKKFRCPETLLILDDAVDSGVLQFGGSVDRVAERGRHIGLTLMIAAQRITSVSRSIRINSDYFFIFKPYSISEVERFLQEFVSYKERCSFKEQLKSYFEKDFQFILVDNVCKFADRLKLSNTHDLMKNKFEQIELTVKRARDVEEPPSAKRFKSM